MSRRYAQHVAGEVAHPEVLIPPLPCLTRYKRDLAVKAAASDQNGVSPPAPRSVHPLC